MMDPSVGGYPSCGIYTRTTSVRQYIAVIERSGTARQHERGRFLPCVRLSIEWFAAGRLVASRDTFSTKPATIYLILKIVRFDLYISF